MEYRFYHLTQTPLAKALPQLLDKALQTGLRASVVCTDATQRDMLDQTLWTFGHNKILPHGVAHDALAAHHPVLLDTTPTRANDATLLVTLNGDVTAPEGFTHVMVLFDGHQETELNAARAQWKTLSTAAKNGAPHTLTYWQQDAKGAWAKAA